jgi:hypothetical protein
MSKAITDILARVVHGPTIMTIEEEHEVVRALMEVDMREVSESLQTLFEVLSLLGDSHVDAFYGMTPADRREFLRFSEWLEGLAGAHPESAAGLVSDAEHFRADPTAASATGLDDRTGSAMATDERLLCRVCGLDQGEPPWGADGRTPSFAICDCCGTEFGYEDGSPQAVRATRERWLASGGDWQNPRTKRVAWDRSAQLARLGEAR